MTFFAKDPISRRRALLALAMAVAAMTVASATAAAQDELTAAWTQQKFTFVQLGFQTRYTCYGLRTYIKSLLLQLGARPEDLNVHEVSCSRNTPPSVAASFWMLEPIPGARVNAVPAHWQTVHIPLTPTATGPDLSGCELAHQTVKRILPYFTTRGAAFDPDCTEHSINGRSYALQAQVLMPGTGAGGGAGDGAR